MFVKGLVARFVGALQLMWLHKRHPDAKVPHLCSEVVVLIEIWSPPELSGCINYVFKKFLMMKLAGTVFVFPLALNRMGSHKSKSAIAASPTLNINISSTEVLPLVFEVLQCVTSALCRNAPNDTL